MRLAPAVIAVCTVVGAASFVPEAWARRGATVKAASAARKPLADSLTGQAKADYLAARALFAAGDAVAALARFEAAFTASSDPRLLWNMAACEKRRKRYASAMLMLENYKSEGAGVLPPADLAKADQLIAAFAGSVGAIEISTSEDGALVRVDGDDVGTTPIAAALRVDRGTRVLRVTKEGFLDWTQTVNVPSAAPVAIRATLVKESPKAPPVADTRPSEAVLPAPAPKSEVTPPAEPARAAALAPIPESPARDDPKGGVGTLGWVLIATGGTLAAAIAIGAAAGSGAGAAPPPVAGTIPPGSIALPLLR